MKLIYTKHALMQMKNRNISKEQVIQTMQHYDEIMKDAYENSIAQKIIGKYLIRVIFRIQNSNKIIISTYRTSKLSKYQLDQK